MKLHELARDFLRIQGKRTAAVADICVRLLHEDSGQDLVEYALIVCFIMLGAIASMKSLVGSIGAVFSGVGSVLTSAL